MLTVQTPQNERSLPMQGESSLEPVIQAFRHPVEPDHVLLMEPQFPCRIPGEFLMETGLRLSLCLYLASSHPGVAVPNTLLEAQGLCSHGESRMIGKMLKTFDPIFEFIAHLDWKPFHLTGDLKTEMAHFVSYHPQSTARLLHRFGGFAHSSNGFHARAIPADQRHRLDLYPMWSNENEDLNMEAR